MMTQGEDKLVVLIGAELEDSFMSKRTSCLMGKSSMDKSYSMDNSFTDRNYSLDNSFMERKLPGQNTQYGQKLQCGQ